MHERCSRHLACSSSARERNETANGASHVHEDKEKYGGCATRGCCNCKKRLIHKFRQGLKWKIIRRTTCLSAEICTRGGRASFKLSLGVSTDHRLWRFRFPLGTRKTCNTNLRHLLRPATSSCINSRIVTRFQDSLVIFPCAESISLIDLLFFFELFCVTIFW